MRRTFRALGSAAVIFLLVGGVVWSAYFWTHLPYMSPQPTDAAGSCLSRAELDAQVATQLPGYRTVDEILCEQDWIYARVVSDTGDPSVVIAHWSNGQWEVTAGGTGKKVAGQDAICDRLPLRIKQEVCAEA